MNLFKTLLLAPAALGLLSPLAASAAPSIALDKYSAADEQVTSVSQFNDVKPTDWAYQALSALVEKYGCVAGYPNGTYGGGKAMTRYEAAALLNACLDRVTEVTDELKKLINEFKAELAVLKGRVDGLEARVGVLEANQFSTTTKLKGIATFVVGGNNYSGGRATEIQNYGSNASPTYTQLAAARQYNQNYGAVTFNYDLRLNLDTSFTGKDLLRTTLRADNFKHSGFGSTPLNNLEVQANDHCGLSEGCGDVVSINRLFYQFPVGSGFSATIGAKVRQDDMLAMWPSVYPGDSVLDIFTYAGAPAAYSLQLGAGAGLTYNDPSGFNASINYVSVNGDNGGTYSGATNPGGIMTGASASTFTAQVGYAAKNWGTAFAYTYAQNTGFAGTPLAAQNFGAESFISVFGETNTSNSIGLSAYWQPSEGGTFVPSISAGWGYTAYGVTSGTSDVISGGVTTTVRNITGTPVAQSWYIGLQWADAFVKGNTAGFAFGQPTFLTSTGVNSAIAGGAFANPNDAGYAFEWWYKFQVTDHISVTPAIFYLTNPGGQLASGPIPVAGTTATNIAAGASTGAISNFGALIKTTFKF